MSQATNHEVAAAKAIVGTLPEEKDIKFIDCPEHPGQHKVKMYVEPHKDAGYWQCAVGEVEDFHDCLESAAQGLSELEVETGVVDYHDPGDYYGHGQREFGYYVCAGEEGCGRAIDNDIADPDLDAAEARADCEADNWDQDR